MKDLEMLNNRLVKLEKSLLLSVIANFILTILVAVHILLTH